MASLNGFDYYEVEFTKDGEMANAAQESAVLDAIARYTDALVMSHGWNNDEAEARALYAGLSREIAAAMQRFGQSPAKFAVVALFWPSKKFADAELIPGGGASVSRDAVLVEKVNRLRDAIAGVLSDGPVDERDPNLDAAIAAIPNLDTSADERARFVDSVRQAMNDRRPVDPGDDASDRLFYASADDLLTRLANADDDFWDEPPKPGSPAASMNPASFQSWTAGGGAASLAGAVTSFKDGARNFLNLFTYYVMKKRAGTVGAKGVAKLLDDIAAKNPAIRLHLIGHSFGGRLVTAACDAARRPVQTLSLLQAAYSHNGLSPDFDGRGSKGFFNGVVTSRKVRGPIVITHTRNDRAVGLAYPLASRLNGDVASGLGDANDPHGGMGSNGAQKSNADTSMALTAGANKFQFRPSTIYNLRADAVISGHSDIIRPEVAAAIVSAVAAA